MFVTPPFCIAHVWSGLSSDYRLGRISLYCVTVFVSLIFFSHYISCHLKLKGKGKGKAPTSTTGCGTSKCHATRSQRSDDDLNEETLDQVLGSGAVTLDVTT